MTSDKNQAIENCSMKHLFDFADVQKRRDIYIRV